MNNLTKWDPFAQLSALQKQLFGDNWLTSTTGSTLATTDVYTKNDNELVVEAHLPNFDEKDIDVHVENGALVIQAESHEKEEDKDKKYVVRESSSSFYRRVQLPERAQEDNIDARIDNGVLKVTVPLKELPAPKKIAIKSQNI